jgi:hypothetical protein
MPRMARSHANSTSTVAPSGLRQYVRLENRPALPAWINSLLGYKTTKDLLVDTKGAADRFDASGRSFLYNHLIGRGSQVGITVDDLERCDENTRAHLAAMKE